MRFCTPHAWTDKRTDAVMHTAITQLVRAVFAVLITRSGLTHFYCAAGNL